MIVLDTNVYSELKGRRFSDHLLHWLDGLPAPDVFITTITVAETEFGLCLLPDGERRKRLTETYAQLETEFGQRILAFSTAAARQYGIISARRHLAGHRIETKDAMIAAICLVEGATLATRNTKDFEGLDLRLVNPFEGG